MINPGFFDLVSGLGWLFGIDLLFWAWAVVTFLAFVNLFVPDPLPFVDEFLLFAISIVLLLLMAARGTFGLIGSAIDVITNPAVVGFTVTLLLLFIGGRIMKNRKVKR